MEFEQGVRTVKIIRGGKFQIPKMRVLNYYDDYGTMELVVNQNFLELWEPIEDECKSYATLEWRSNVDGNKFRVKIDERTHIFDANSKLVPEVPQLHNKFVTCIIELKSVYTFKGFSGISIRVHQMKINESSCAFLDEETDGGDS